MSLDLKAEVEHAEFLDWVQNNTFEIIEDLLMDNEDLLVAMWEDYRV